jgi:hypothetical protein
MRPPFRALVRVHRWRRELEGGHAKSITDLAEQECLSCALTRLFAPDIVEAILNARQPNGAEKLVVRRRAD